MGSRSLSRVRCPALAFPGILTKRLSKDGPNAVKGDFGASATWDGGRGQARVLGKRLTRQ